MSVSSGVEEARENQRHLFAKGLSASLGPGVHCVSGMSSACACVWCDIGMLNMGTQARVC